MLRRSYWRVGLLLLMSALALIAAVACGDDDEKTVALARVEVLEQQVADLESSKQAEISALARVEVLESAKAELETARAALEQALDTTARQLFVKADTVGAGCVQVSRAINDGDGEFTFRIKVVDPVTGEEMDDTTVTSVILTLADGQTFETEYGGHGRPEPTDFFWAVKWEVPKGYPAGSVPYTVTATASDGRSGMFEEFKISPSTLTVEEAS